MEGNTIVIHVSASSEEEALAQAEAHITEAIKKAANVLAIATEAKVRELASEELKTTRQTYLDALSLEEVADGIWVVNLDKDAVWIEEGTPERSGYDFLLNGPNAKVGKDGHKYNIIPFEHSKPRGQNTPKAQAIVDGLKRELKKQNIPFKKIEVDGNGSPLIGRIHKLNLFSEKPSANAKHPALHGVTIYQRKSATGKVQRDIMTFRIISSKTKGDGRWQYPEKEGKEFLDRAMDYVMQNFESIFAESLEDAIKNIT